MFADRDLKRAFLAGIGGAGLVAVVVGLFLLVRTQQGAAALTALSALVTAGATIVLVIVTMRVRNDRDPAKRADADVGRQVTGGR